VALGDQSLAPPPLSARSPSRLRCAAAATCGGDPVCAVCRRLLRKLGLQLDKKGLRLIGSPKRAA
jgi:hypothetical protein